MMDKRIVLLFFAIVLALRFVDPIRGFISGAMTLSSPSVYKPMDPKTEWIVTGWTLLAFFLGVVASADWGKKGGKTPEKDKQAMKAVAGKSLNKNPSEADEVMDRLKNEYGLDKTEEPKKTPEPETNNAIEDNGAVCPLPDGSQWYMRLVAPAPSLDTQKMRKIIEILKESETK